MSAPLRLAIASVLLGISLRSTVLPTAASAPSPNPWPAYPAKLVADHTPAVRNESIHFLTQHNGLAYFTSDTWPNGRQLWRTDGSITGTWQLDAPYLAQPYQDPQYPTYFAGLDFVYVASTNDVIYFARENISRLELWRTNGEADSMRLVGTLPNSTPGILNGAKLFSINDTLILITRPQYDVALDVWRGEADGMSFVQIAHIDLAGKNPIAVSDGSTLRIVFLIPGSFTVDIVNINLASGAVTPEASAYRNSLAYSQFGYGLLHKTQNATIYQIGNPGFNACGYVGQIPIESLLVLETGKPGASNLRAPALLGFSSTSSRDGVLYLDACTTTGRRELWRTDASGTGVEFVARIDRSFDCFFIYALERNVACMENGALKGIVDRSFSVWTGGRPTHTIERGDHDIWVVNGLWRMDGTNAGTRLLKLIEPPRGYANYMLLANALLKCDAFETQCVGTMTAVAIDGPDTTFQRLKSANTGTSDSSITIPAENLDDHTLYQHYQLIGGPRGQNFYYPELHSVSSNSSNSEFLKGDSEYLKRVAPNQVILGADPYTVTQKWITDGTVSGTIPYTGTIAPNELVFTYAPQAEHLFEHEGMLYFGTGGVLTATAIQTVPLHATLHLMSGRLFIIGSTEAYGRELYVLDSPARDLGVSLPALTPALNGHAVIDVLVGNGSLTPSLTSTLTITLPPQLAYVSDTIGVSNTVGPGVLRWSVPALEPFERRHYQLQMTPVSNTLGARHTLSASIAFSGLDAVPANDTATGSIMIATAAYLPILTRR